MTTTELRAGYATIKSGRYQNGADYRGTLTDGKQAVWVCEHQHSFATSRFLNKGQRSALSCAMAELERRSKS